MRGSVSAPAPGNSGVTAVTVALQAKCEKRDICTESTLQQAPGGDASISNSARAGPSQVSGDAQMRRRVFPGERFCAAGAGPGSGLAVAG